MKHPDVMGLLEDLVSAETNEGRRAFAERRLGSTHEEALAAVHHMRRLVAVVVEASRDPEVRARLEMFRSVVDATGVVPETTLRSPSPTSATAPPDDTQPSPQHDTVRVPAPDFSAVSAEGEGATASVIRSIVRHVVADTDETTLQGGNAPMKPSIMCRNLLRAGDVGRALDLYAALCAETEADPTRRRVVHVMFGLMTESQRRQLDGQFEELFAEQPELRGAFEQRVSILKERLSQLRSS